MPGGKFRGWAARVSLGWGLGLGLGWLRLMGAQSFHPYNDPPPWDYMNPRDHIRSITGYETENACLDIFGVQYDLQQARAEVAMTLGDQQGWERLMEGAQYMPWQDTVTFAVSADRPCGGGHEIWINLRSLAEIHRICGRDDVVACAGFEGGTAVYDPATQDYEWGRSLISVDVDAFAGWQRTNIVNHEVGHALGLDDGGPAAPGGNPGNPACPDPPSIMHVYGCGPIDPWTGEPTNGPFIDHPSDMDIATVESYIPGGGDGGGNFNKFG